MARGTFGERLKRERELREVPMEEITVATRIGPRFLEALENEDWEKLPGGVFNRGFVRSIARYLGLDEEAFLAEYDLAHNAHAQLLQQKQAHKAEERIPPTPLWVPIAYVLGITVLLAGLIAGGIYGWRRYVRRHSAPNSSFTILPAPSRPVLLDLNVKAIPAFRRPAPPVQFL
jgi:cytoskeletal protein RodZ